MYVLFIYWLNLWFVFKDNVLRWERAVQDDEDALESAKQAEQKQLQEIDKDMRELDRLKAERLNKKSEVDAMDEQIGKVSHLIFFVITKRTLHRYGPQHLNNHVLNFYFVNLCRQGEKLDPSQKKFKPSKNSFPVLSQRWNSAKQIATLF